MIKHSVLRLNGESEVRSDLPHSQWHSDSDGGFHVALINLQHELDNRLIFPFLSIIKISSVRIGGISWFRNEYDEWWKTHTHTLKSSNTLVLFLPTTCITLLFLATRSFVEKKYWLLSPILWIALLKKGNAKAFYLMCTTAHSHFKAFSDSN